MGRKLQTVAADDAGTPASIEAALRRVRLLAGLLILIRFIATASLPNTTAVVLVGAFWSVNILSFLAQRSSARTRARCVCAVTVSTTDRTASASGPARVAPSTGTSACDSTVS